MMASAASYSSIRSSMRSPAAKAWMRNCTRWRIHLPSAGVSWPCSCTPCSPAALTISTTRREASSRNTPTVMISGGSRRAMSRAWVTAIWRGEGANTKPTASAPMATASRASSSLVIPQILTNTPTPYRRARLVPVLPAAGGRWSGGQRGAQGGHRGGRSRRGHQGLARPARRGSRPGAARRRRAGPRMPDSATAHHARRHPRRQPHGPGGVDLEGDQVPLVDPDQVGAHRQRPLQLALVVHLDQRVEAELAGQAERSRPARGRRGRPRSAAPRRPP